MLVSMYMTADVATVRPQDDGARAVALMVRHGVRSLPVVDGDKLVGVISRSDLVRTSPSSQPPFAPEQRARSRLGFTVELAMVRAVRTIGPNDSIDLAVSLLDAHKLNSLVVVKDGAVLGMLSRSDILRAFREIVFDPRATRISLAAEDGVDVMGQLLRSQRFGELELRAYAEHRNPSGRFVLITLAGKRAAIDDVLDTAWSAGVRVVQVQRPGAVATQPVAS